MSGPIFPECADFQKGPLCYSCGLELCNKRRCGRKQRCPRGCSVEHIPPKAFFSQHKHIKGITSNPIISEITVSSCFPCNQKASKSDEYFIRYIVILASAYSPIANEILCKTRDKWRKNKKISREFSQAKHGFYDIQTPSGMVVAHRHAVTLPQEHSDRFYECLHKIVKGLYYKHEGKCLNKPVKLAWASSLFRKRGFGLQTEPLNPEMLHVLKTAFASEDLERMGNGMMVVVRHRSLQNNLFRYAFLNLKFQNGDEWPIVFLSFYDSAQFIYLLDEKEENT